MAVELAAVTLDASMVDISIVTTRIARANENEALAGPRYDGIDGEVG